MDRSAAQRLALAVELMEIGVARVEARLRAEHPDVTEDEIRAGFDAAAQPEAARAPSRP